MRPVDYLIDARDILLGRQPYEGSEFQGLLQRIPHEWRCMVRLHYPEFSHWGGSYIEPPEYGYGCVVCGDDGALPIRIRLADWFYNSPFIYDVLSAKDKLIARLRKRYCELHENWYEWPCEACEWNAEQGRP